MERAIMCPQCNAPLAPHRFARSTVCAYCGATVQLDETSVSTAIFHEAFRIWNSPETYQVSSWFSIGESHWTLEKCIARGEYSDVYTGRRARWPTELVIVKMLRDRKNLETFENEWVTLQMLHGSNAPGADTFTTLLPQLVTHGDISSSSYSGKRVNIFRWESGFNYTFDEIMHAYPHGIHPRASIWVWRRILEMLSFLHNSGIVHSAVLPEHLLVQDNDHGVRLVDYSFAGRIGDRIKRVSQHLEFFYPRSKQSHLVLTPQLDLTMSAKCIIALLGGNPETGTLPSNVPSDLAGVIRRVALTDPAVSAKEKAWDLREELGAIANKVFGAPQFIPIVMPS